MNRLFLSLMVAVMTVSLAACGDGKSDEPAGEVPAEGLHYPTFPAGRKAVRRIEKIFDNQRTVTLDMQYDAEGHLIAASMNMPYSDGTNNESIRLYYSRGIISHTLGWQTTEYSFATNALGAITSITNSQDRVVAHFDYIDNRLQSHMAVGGTTTYSNRLNWKNSDRLHDIVTIGIVSSMTSNRDSVGLAYTSFIPNVASIDFMGIGQTPFGEMMELAMRNAGLFGAVSADLPRALNCGSSSYLDENGKMIQLHCIVNYNLNSDGSVESLRFNVPRTNDDQKPNNMESYTLKYTYK